VREEDASNVAAIPAQNRLTLECGYTFKISSRPLRTHAMQNSFACVRSSAWSLRLRTQFYAQRWPA
jgi:hypothetical protein